MFQKIYAMPEYLLFIYFLSFMLIWIVLSYVVYKYEKVKFWKIINIVFFIFSILLILSLTVFNRKSADYKTIILNPLTFFERVKIQDEIYRSMFMNIMLFVPFGIFLPFLFKKEKIFKNVMLTFVFGLCLSIMVESFQYIFKAGQADVTDIICNVIGVLFGSLTYVVSIIIVRNIKKSNAKDVSD